MNSSIGVGVADHQRRDDHDPVHQIQWFSVTRCSRRNIFRMTMTSVATMANPLKIAPATKYGGKIVVCQPGRTDDREVERHHAMHRQHQRRRQAREQQIGLLVVAPRPGTALASPGSAGRR